MGLVKVLSFARRVIRGANIDQVKCDASKDELVTVDHYSSPGDDSPPLPGDKAHIEPQEESGKYTALGYADPKNEGKSSPGEKRIFARDKDGNEVAEVWIKKDGSVTVSNSNGSLTMAANGNISLGSGGDGIARLNDEVTVTILAGSLETSDGATAPAVDTDVTGTITSASTNNTSA